MSDCVFCKIINNEIPSARVYEDDRIIAINDLNPMAPVHVLFIPKDHICCANAITAENSSVIAHIFETVPKVAKELGLDNGYRVVNNCGEDGGQSVMHIHFHLLGGKKLSLGMG